MSNNLIERSWSVFEEMQRRQGNTVDEISFVGGFMACYGVLSGNLDIGLPPGTTIAEALNRIQRELEDHRRAAMARQDNGRG